MSDRRIADLVADMQVKAMQFEAQAGAALAQLAAPLGPSTVAITVTFRSGPEQAVAKAKGLSAAGPGDSPHNCELADGTPAARAFDFAVFGPDGSYVTDGTDPRYAACGAIAKALGLAWGGDWHHPDYDHIEMVDWRDA